MAARVCSALVACTRPVVDPSMGERATSVPLVNSAGGHAQDLKQGVGRGGHGRSVARQARWRSVAQRGQGGIQGMTGGPVRAVGGSVAISATGKVS